MPLSSAGSRSMGFTCFMFALPLSLAGLVNASLRKPPALRLHARYQQFFSIINVHRTDSQRNRKLQ